MPQTVGSSNPPRSGGMYPRRLSLPMDERGATSLEWALVLAAVALPSYFILKTLLFTLLGYYQMMTALNAMPFP